MLKIKKYTVLLILGLIVVTNSKTVNHINTAVYKKNSLAPEIFCSKDKSRGNIASEETVIIDRNYAGLTGIDAQDIKSAQTVTLNLASKPLDEPAIERHIQTSLQEQVSRLTQTDIDNIPKIKQGDVLEDRYEVLGCLGVGGCARTHKAFDRQQKKHVVLKIPRYDSHIPMEQKKRIITTVTTEADIMLKYDINHPNICQAYRSINKGTILVMEFIQGTELAKILKTLKTNKLYKLLSLHQRLFIIEEILQALSVLHSQGIVHRDVKPQNVIVKISKRYEEIKVEAVKLIDLGIAKQIQQKTITRTGVIKGTIEYSSPEQLCGGEFGKVRIPSDIFSAGVFLYSILTGRRPFQESNHMALMMAITEKNPKPFTPSDNIPKELQKIILKALEKHQENRYQTADQMLYAIRSYRIRAVLSGKKSEIYDLIAAVKMIEHINNNEELFKISKIYYKQFYKHAQIYKIITESIGEDKILRIEKKILGNLLKNSPRLYSKTWKWLNKTRLGDIGPKQISPVSLKYKIAYLFGAYRQTTQAV